MTNDEYKDKYAALFAAKDMDELAQAFSAAVDEHAANGFPTPGKDELAAQVADAYKKAEPNWQAHYAAKAKRNGVVYEADGVNGDGHTISWYRVLVEGKTVLWASVDNDLVHANGPKGTTAHLITVWNATRTVGTTTAGTALRGAAKDGTRVFGQTVTSFVAPRAHRWIAEFYGV